MKYFCLDRDSCGFTRKITDEEFSQIDFSSPFSHCEQCNYYAVLVKDDFTLENVNNINSVLNSSLRKILHKKEKKDENNINSR
tara:strand:- start:66 stop:314 length:249 start_codon:yes stop_codon:yes gene_type:complete